MIDIKKFEKSANEIIANVKKDAMKEQDLVDLGFERTDVSEIESGGDPFHYYTLDFSKGFGLISNANDEVTTVAGHHRWYVEVFEAPEINFVEKKDIKQLIDIIKRNTHARKIR